MPAPVLRRFCREQAACVVSGGLFAGCLPRHAHCSVHDRLKQGAVMHRPLPFALAAFALCACGPSFELGAGSDALRQPDVAGARQALVTVALPMLQASTAWSMNLADNLARVRLAQGAGDLSLALLSPTP